MTFNDALIILIAFSYLGVFCSPTSVQGLWGNWAQLEEQHNLLNDKRSVATGTSSSASHRKGYCWQLLRADCSAPSEGPHQCVSTGSCAPSPVSLQVSQLGSSDQQLQQARKGNLGCSATLLCWQRTGMGRDRDRPGPTADPCHRLSLMEPWGHPSSGVLQLKRTHSCQLWSTFRSVPVTGKALDFQDNFPNAVW